jgi:hypothetical protein
MDNWIAYIIIGVAVVLLIGNFSTFQKSTHHKMRKTNLNELEETLPRSTQSAHKMPTIDNSKLKK